MSDVDTPLPAKATAKDPAGFRIFRFETSPSVEEAGVMTSHFDVAPEVGALMVRALGAGLLEGQQTRILFQIPGFSLIHAWFKPDYPLPLHSHNADCLYYVAAGSLKLGKEILGVGDGFFVPAEVPYTYTPGPSGVEVLEIRHETHFNLTGHSKTAAFWEKAINTLESNRESWSTFPRP